MIEYESDLPPVLFYLTEWLRFKKAKPSETLSKGYAQHKERIKAWFSNLLDKSTCWHIESGHLRPQAKEKQDKDPVVLIALGGFADIQTKPMLTKEND